jgi:hypothetical protein
VGQIQAEEKGMIDKYRIEKGEVKIPISEFNRVEDNLRIKQDALNEDIKELEQLRERLEETNKNVSEYIKNNTPFVVTSFLSSAWNPLREDRVDTIDSEEWPARLVIEKIEEKFKHMTIVGFLRWQRNQR